MAGSGWRELAMARDPMAEASIPAAMWRLLDHPAVTLKPYEQKQWPIRWEFDEWGERVPEISIDLAVDRGWCVGHEGQHGLTVESLTDVECALHDLCECACGACVDNSDRYVLEEWA
jgi:hypothetical protein